MEFLGRSISCEKTSLRMENMETIFWYPSPKNVKNTQQFLDATNVYRGYIDRYTELCLPLTNPLEKDVPQSWMFVCEAAVNSLEAKISESPILAIFDSAKPSLIYTNASQSSIVAMLKQTDSCNISLLLPQVIIA